MALIAAEDAKRGPYQPCPCGSGKKFRFCHGDRAPHSPFSRLESCDESRHRMDCSVMPHSGHCCPKHQPAATMEQPSDRSIAHFGFNAFLHGQGRQLQPQINQKEGINHGYKATEYPDPLGR